jgi:hypothetical protein
MEVLGNGRLRVQNKDVFYGCISLPQKGFFTIARFNDFSAAFTEFSYVY